MRPRHIAILPLLALAPACKCIRPDDDALARGVAHSEAGRYAAAVGAYEQVLDAHPASARVLDLYGEALLETGDYAKSLDACRRAQELDPALPTAHSHAGQALVELGRYEEARASFERALALRPDDEHVQRYIALVDRRTGR
jgi:tetratricopeptide (TPR) repeat protein